MSSRIWIQTVSSVIPFFIGAYYGNFSILFNITFCRNGYPCHPRGPPEPSSVLVFDVCILNKICVYTHCTLFYSVEVHASTILRRPIRRACQVRHYYATVRIFYAHIAKGFRIFLDICGISLIRWRWSVLSWMIRGEQTEINRITLFL